MPLGPLIFKRRFLALLPATRANTALPYARNDGLSVEGTPALTWLTTCLKDKQRILTTKTIACFEINGIPEHRNMAGLLNLFHVTVPKQV